MDKSTPSDSSLPEAEPAVGADLERTRGAGTSGGEVLGGCQGVPSRS